MAFRSILARAALGLSLGSAIVVGGDASAIAIPDVVLLYDLQVIESDVPSLPVGTFVPDNYLNGDLEDDGPGRFLLRAGYLGLAGLLTFEVDGAPVTDDASGWRFETTVSCNLCAILFGQVPDDSTDISATTVIELPPSDSGLPPAPWNGRPIRPGRQTIVFVADPGVVIGTAVAKIVPAPPTVLAMGLAALGLVRSARRQARDPLAEGPPAGD